MSQMMKKSFPEKPPKSTQAFFLQYDSIVPLTLFLSENSCVFIKWKKCLLIVKLSNRFASKITEGSN